MPSPWDDKQKPNERSPFHDKKDKNHNEHEHGLGGRKPDKEHEDRAKRADSLEVLLVAASIPTTLATAADDSPVLAGFAAYWYQTNRPPITDQGSTSRC